MFRKPRFIIITAVVLYAIAMSFVWLQIDAKAEKRLVEMLESAEKGHSDVIDGEIDAALRYIGGAIINTLGPECGPQSLERMRELAEAFNVDEVNIVNTDGIVIGSNLPSVLGFDFKSSQLTREFLSLTNSTVSIVSQPFRNGVANPEMFCKYHGMAFPGHKFFLQLGITVSRLKRNMYSYSPEESEAILRSWHFSVDGWYERAEDDPDFAPGRIVRRMSDLIGKMSVGRYFDYYGYRYIALLPEDYCYAQRNSSFMVVALTLGALIFLFTFVMVRLATASETLRKLHADADARNAEDMALARTIQMAALPSADGAFMECMEFTLAAECCPAREVGGDFYDFFHVNGDRLAFLVADVSGKGIPGAMFMMEARNVIKNCLVEYMDISEAVTEANRRLCASNKAELFVTAWIGVMNRTGEFEYVNAGHNRPFIRRSDGTVEKVMGRGGMFLGMLDTVVYRAHSLRLRPGDILCLYTDGISEAMNEKHEQFGEARLVAEIASGKRRIREAAREFAGGAEQSDDMTSLAVFWHGKPECRSRDFAADDTSLSPALDFLREAFAGVSDRKAVASMLNAADEITSNIVNYSGAKGYRIETERTADRMRIRFLDDGRPYNPLSHVDPDTHASIEDRPVGGLGLVVVKRLADRVTYSHEDGRNVLTLIKKCKSLPWE